MGRMSFAILERFDCGDCADQFYVKKREGEKVCPYCGSTNTEIDGKFEADLSEVSE